VKEDDPWMSSFVQRWTNTSWGNYHEEEKGEQGTREPKFNRRKGWIKGNDMWSGWLWGLGLLRDREPKVNVQVEDERKEVILPHRKVGSTGEYKRARGKSISRAGTLSCK